MGLEHTDIWQPAIWKPSAADDPEEKHFLLVETTRGVIYYKSCVGHDQLIVTIVDLIE